MNIKTMIDNEVNISSNNSPKVSIIVATYRRKETLERALQSLTAQTYPNFEVVVVDDNADVEWNIEVEKIVNSMKRLGDPEIIYFQNKINKGSAETRNIGINLATGEYVTFLDDDDIYLPDKVKKQVEQMIKEDADYSITDLWLYDEKDRLIEIRTRDYIYDYSLESLMRYHIMYHLTGTDVIMFKKKYLIEIGLFSPINVGDEFHLMQKAIEKNGVFNYLPGCDVKAYVHIETDGLSSGDGKIKGENELFEYKKRYFDKLTKKDQRYVKMRHYAVIAYAEFRRKRYFSVIKYSCLSLMFSPTKFIDLLFKRK